MQIDKVGQLSTIYLQKREARLVQVVKITEKTISVASLKVAKHSTAEITNDVLEYIPKSQALEFLVAINDVAVDHGYNLDEIKRDFIENNFVPCDHYPYAQIHAHYIETPDGLN